ncbi:hypothetical protein JCM19376_17070 [Fusibacter bizertensis]
MTDPFFVTQTLRLFLFNLIFLTKLLFSKILCQKYFAYNTFTKSLPQFNFRLKTNRIMNLFKLRQIMVYDKERIGGDSMAKVMVVDDDP